jgi:hypothetical protein
MLATHLNKHMASLMAILHPRKLKVTLLPIHNLMLILHMATQGELD